MKSTLLRSSSMVALCAVLTACGGSGNAPTPTVPTTPTGPITPTQPPSSFRTTEYNVDYSLAAIKAAEAYSKGFTGEGAKLGFVDYNFEFDNDEINWGSASRDRDQQWVTMYEDFLGVSATDSHHGHWVASIAAAKKNDFAMHGVAYDAEVIAVDFYSGVNMHTERWNGVTYYVADPYTYLYNNGARVISKSFGYDEEDFIADPPASGGNDNDGDGISGNEHYINVDASTFIELGGLVVAAAGNDGDPEPMVSNLETLQDAVDANWYGTNGFFIIAGSVNSAGEISDFSDRAGSVGAPRPIGVGGGTYSVDPSQYYMVAPGEDVAVNWDGSSDGIGFGDGTSFAAPHISGAAALLFGRWPQLTAREVGAILLNSATDLGASGVDSVYGRGMLNIDAATEPLGSVSMVINSLNMSVGTQGSMMSLGAAFGDATPTALGEVMLLDSYNRDFYMDMRQHVITTDPRLNLAGVMELGIEVDAGMWQIGNGLEMGFTSRRSDLSADMALALAPSQQIFAQDQIESWHLRGAFDANKRWAVGSGAALSDVMISFASSQRPNNQFYVTGHRAFASMGGDSYYMASEMALDKDYHLGVGFKSTRLRGMHNNALELYRDTLPSWEIEARLSKSYSKGTLSFAVGALVEKDTVLGSRSSGGFKLADETRTIKFDVFADYNVTQSLTLIAKAHVGRSEVDASDASLFAGLNDFITSSWSFELSGADILQSDDAFGFKVSQPLRVENAEITLQGASSFNYALKAPLYEVRDVSFSPSSREIAAEVAYKKSFGNWTVEANLAERLNAGHIKGLHDTVAIIRLAKMF